jgi:hypothetical protein
MLTMDNQSCVTQERVEWSPTFASHSLASITPTGTWRRRGDDDKFKFDVHAQTVFSTPVSMGECGVPGDVCIAFTTIDNTYRHVETARRRRQVQV